MNFNGYAQSVRKEIEAIHDTHLEKGGDSEMLQPKKKEWDLSKYLFFLNKVSLKNNKASK